MASNESTYYQLPIWNTDDPVLREEFNELNNKLDMLLHAIPCMEVCKKQVSEETYSVSMDVSMLDLTGFACLYLGYSVPGVSNFSVRTNGIGENVYHINQEYGNFDLEKYKTSVLINLTPGQGNALIFYPPSDESSVALSKLTAYCDQGYFRTSIYTGIAPVTWSELKTLDFETSGTPFPVGSYFWLLGMRLL
ncbi:MAG: hypothetical protein DBX97_22835 [Collinsella tanakaei]|nr:MAG: hypothetical protein DBX97_22835 [Collinsella tanakaei]